MAIGGPKAIDDAPARGAGAQRRMAAVDFLASRGMGEPGSLRDLSRGVVPQGKKVDPSAVAAQAIEAQPPFG